MTSCLLLLLASCGAHISGDQPAQDDAAVDAALIADGASDGLAFGPWSPPATVTAAATRSDEDDVTLSSNALEMIFAVAGTTGKDLYYTSRPAIGAAWTAIAKLPFDTDTTSEESPRFSGDDLTLYFATNRGTSGTLDIYSATRTMTGTNAAWGKSQPVLGVNTGGVEKWLAPCGSNRYVVVRDSTNAGTELYEGTFGGGDPLPIDALNTASNETGAFLTQDCLTIYFASNRKTRVQIYTSQRKAIGQPWQPAQPVDDFKINGIDNQQDPWLSADGHSFAFASDAGGTNDVYLSTR
jgi:hypothetical protein